MISELFLYLFNSIYIQALYISVDDDNDDEWKKRNIIATFYLSNTLKIFLENKVFSL